MAVPARSRGCASARVTLPGRCTVDAMRSRRSHAAGIWRARLISGPCATTLTLSNAQTQRGSNASVLGTALALLNVAGGHLINPGEAGAAEMGPSFRMRSPCETSAPTPSSYAAPARTCPLGSNCSPSLAARALSPRGGGSALGRQLANCNVARVDVSAQRTHPGGDRVDLIVRQFHS
jgi:hypothetical protein